MDKNLVALDGIMLNQSYTSKEEFFQRVGSDLKSRGKVKEGFLEAIASREETYPTGLDTGEIKVAIPHTDYQYANTSQLIIATLAQPVNFSQMDDPDLEIGVKVIILILFDKPEKQIEILEQIMKIVKDQALLKELLGAETPEKVQSLLLGQRKK